MAGVKVQDEPNYADQAAFLKIMNSSRKCRDVLCIPLFIAFWVGMLFVLHIGMTFGDPAKLIFGTDYVGNTCGSSTSQCYNGTSCGKFLTYPRLDQDLYVAQLEGALTNPALLLKFPFHSICRSQCPDAKQDNWVCNYETMQTLSDLYGASSNLEVPSDRARIALEMCLIEKSKVPFMVGISSLPTALAMGDGYTANCVELMQGCFKMYAPEESLFFRCVPITEDNSTCLHSPYLDANNISVSVRENDDGSHSTRPASDEFCGECLEPRLGFDGSPMDPSSESCKAKKVISNSLTTEAKMNPLMSTANSWTEVLQSWLGDVYGTWPQILLCGAVAPFVMGILWLIILRLAAKMFIFTVLYGLFFFLCFMSIQFLIYGGVITPEILSGLLDQLNNATGIGVDSGGLSGQITSVDLFETENEAQTEMYEIVGWVLVGTTVLYLLFLCLLRKRIKIAIAVIQEATVAIAAMPSILFFPIFTVLGTLAISGYFAIGCVYLASMGEIELPNATIIQGNATLMAQQVPHFRFLRESGASVEHFSMRTIQNSFQAEETTNPRQLIAALEAPLSPIVELVLSNVKDLPYIEIFLFYHLMGYFWTNQLIEAIGATTIAGAIGSWYWSTTEEKMKKKRTPRMPVFRALGRVFRYHIGSLIFGSFIIALVQLIRAILMYVDKNTQGLQKKNKLIRVLMKVIQCCLCVLERLLKYITKNAFIYIALFGKSFCTSTREVFTLLVSNFARIGTATLISNLVIALGRILILVASCFLCSTVLSFTEEGTEFLAGLGIDFELEDPGSIVPPLIITGLLAWFVSGCFMSVYGLAIDTLMISFCVDDQKNDGSEDRPYYMTKSLKKITSKTNKTKVKPNDASDKSK